jgi:hypothetical protein
VFVTRALCTQVKAIEVAAVGALDTQPAEFASAALNLTTPRFLVLQVPDNSAAASFKA